MRINRFIASSSSLSRRAADIAISSGRVRLNGSIPDTGQDVTPSDVVTLDGVKLVIPSTTTTIMLNKPVGYVCSRNGQGSSTIYELLPAELQDLQPIGRLDKNSSGLLLLTNDGALAQQLTHPSFQKAKIYDIKLNQPLQPLHQQMISDHGITLADGISRLQLQKNDDDRLGWQVTMHEGRNRQIRRTFSALGYEVDRLHRIQFGHFMLKNLDSGTIYRLPQ